jgi:DNA-directed RNA polymerase subunit RPC12/RpoP
MPRRQDGRRIRYMLAVARGQLARRPKTLRCSWCGGKIIVKPKGKLPDYCKPSCRQRAYEARKWRQPHLAAFRQDYAKVLSKDAIRAEVVAVLREMGMPAPPSRQRQRPQLHIIKSNDDDQGTQDPENPG